MSDVSSLTAAYGAVVLRPFLDEDLDTVVAGSADPYVRSLTGLEPGDEASAHAYIRRQRLRGDRGLGFSFAITDGRTGVAVGQIGLWLRAVAPDGATGYMEEAHGRAALGYWVSPECRGNGFASDALQALTAFAFVGEHTQRLELFIEPTNVASWRAAERAGFQREGLLRSWQQIGDTRRDMYVYSRLPGDEPASA